MQKIMAALLGLYAIVGVFGLNLKYMPFDSDCNVRGTGVYSDLSWRTDAKLAVVGLDAHTPLDYECPAIGGHSARRMSLNAAYGRSDGVYEMSGKGSMRVYGHSRFVGPFTVGYRAFFIDGPIQFTASIWLEYGRSELNFK